MKWVLSCLLAFVCSFGFSQTAEEYKQAGMAALNASQADPDKIVDAAKNFVKAVESYERDNNEVAAVEINSFLYWCKKKMTLEQIGKFAGGGAEEKKIVQRLEKVVTQPVKVDDAAAYLAAADQFASSRPNDHYLIAIRYFEVAERFKGTPASLKAQEISLREMQAVLKQQTQPALPSNRKVFTGPPEKLVGKWVKINTGTVFNLNKDQTFTAPTARGEDYRKGTWSVEKDVLTFAFSNGEKKTMLILTENKTTGDEGWEFHRTGVKGR